MRVFVFGELLACASSFFSSVILESALTSDGGN